MAFASAMEVTVLLFVLSGDSFGYDQRGEEDVGAARCQG
jgi:hypothetical protein